MRNPIVKPPLDGDSMGTVAVQVRATCPSEALTLYEHSHYMIPAGSGGAGQFFAERPYVETFKRGHYIVAQRYGFDI